MALYSQQQRNEQAWILMGLSVVVVCCLIVAVAA